MSYRSVIYSESFWQFLKLIIERPQKKCVADLCKTLGIEKSEIDEFLAFVKTLGIDLRLSEENGHAFLYLAQKPPKISFEFDLADWLALQAYLPKLVENTKIPYFQILAERLESVEKLYPQHDLFCALDVEKKRHFFKNNPAEYIKGLEKHLLSRFPISVELEDKSIGVFIHRLVFLEGKLCVIGEDINERCLVYFSVASVKNLEETQENSYVETYSSQEVDDFIEAMRNLVDSEKRLVLKIPPGGHIDLNPTHQFLGRPYITSNMEGDIIWAASIEPSNDLYEWLLSIKDQVEILDPISVKREFLEFCQRKLSEIKKPAA